jgi:GT2 family glycosyltransferase
VADVAAQFDARIVSGNNTSTAGSARNIGAGAARAKILAFVDADCCAEPQWLTSLHDSLSSGLVAVGGPVLDYFPYHPVAVIDNLMQFVDQMPGRPADRAREFPGCNMAVRRDAFEATGGFPEDIFPGEDTVFSQRLSQEQSALVCFLPAMRIRHRGRTSISEFMQHQQEFGFNRGRYALNITKRQQTLGRRLPIAALAAARRVGYFFYRTMQWNISSLPRLVIFSPLLLIGLFAWARGFSRGCELASMEHYESASSS